MFSRGRAELKSKERVGISQMKGLRGCFQMLGTRKSLYEGP